MNVLLIKDCLTYDDFFFAPQDNLVWQMCFEVLWSYRKILRLGAQKVKPALPTLAIALASVDIAAPIEWNKSTSKDAL